MPKVGTSIFEIIYALVLFRFQNVALISALTIFSLFRVGHITSSLYKVDVFAG